MEISIRKCILFFSFLLIIGNLTGENEEITFENKLKKVEIIEDLQDLLEQAAKSKRTMTLFTDKIEEFVNQRSDDDLDSLRTIINYAIYNQEVQKYKSIINRLKNLRTRASKPMTTSEKIKILQRMVSIQKKINEFRENQQDFLNKITSFVIQRTDQTRDDILNLLNTIKLRKIFLNSEYEDKLIELIEIVPQPVNFYEKVLMLSIQLPSMTADEVEEKAKNLTSKFDKQDTEIKEKSREKLIYILNAIIYNPQFSTTQKKWAKNSLSKIKTESTEEIKTPKKYSEKIRFFYNKSLNQTTLKNDDQRGELLSELSKLAKSKLKASSTDLQILTSTLKFLLTTKQLSELEKIQVDQLISALKEVTSVSDIISKIYSLLSDAETNADAKNQIVKLIIKATNSLIAQIKKDQKVPDENEMIQNLLDLYIIDSATYSSDKNKIEKKREELQKAINSIKASNNKTKTTDSKKEKAGPRTRRLSRFRRK